MKSRLRETMERDVVEKTERAARSEIASDLRIDRYRYRKVKFS